VNTDPADASWGDLAEAWLRQSREEPTVHRTGIALGLESLLEAHRDLCVIRDSEGDVTIWQSLPDGGTRVITISYRLRSAAGPAEMVLCAYTAPAAAEGLPRLPAYTYIVQEEGKLLVDSMAYTDQRPLDRAALLDTARAGLEILRAFRAASEPPYEPVASRVKDYFRRDTAASATRLSYMLHDLGAA
jgi:hypothetical protein